MLSRLLHSRLIKVLPLCSRQQHMKLITAATSDVTLFHDCVSYIILVMIIHNTSNSHTLQLQDWFSYIIRIMVTHNTNNYHT